MKSELLVIAAFLLIVGMAMGYYSLLKLRSTEGMALAVLTVIAVMFLSGKFQNFHAGVIVCAGLGICGGLVFMLRTGAGRGKSIFVRLFGEPEGKNGFFSMGMVSACILFFGATVAFHRDFIQNIDDFHQWAAAVKYMLEKGRLPADADFLGSASMPMYTSVFHLFFQMIGGYHEGNMYASAVLLSAVPLMLPLGDLKWREWRKAFLYIFITYIGLYSLYVHPYKSLYVDLPLAAWSGSFCVWWSLTIRREDPDKYRSLLLAFPMFCFILEIKFGTGIVMGCFNLLYLAVDCFLALGKEKTTDIWHRRRKQILPLLAAGILALAGVALVFLRYFGLQFSQLEEVLLVSTDQAKLTLTKLIYNIFHKKLSEFSAIPLTVATSVVPLCAGMLIFSGCVGQRYRKLLKWAGIFSAFGTAAYLYALYGIYVMAFSYEESVSNAAVHRYLSIIVMFVFFLFTGLFLIGYEEREKKAGRIRELAFCMSILCTLGVNDNFLFKASSLNSESIAGYKSMTAAKKMVKKIKKITEPTDRVYLLVQKNSLENLNEWPMAAALYYGEDCISNYLKTPWKFYEGGSLSFLTNSELTMEDFPDLLEEGGYTYIWVYSSDEYLEEQFRIQFDYDGDTVEAGLYQLIYEDGEIAGIRLVEKAE